MTTQHRQAMGSDRFGNERGAALLTVLLVTGLITVMVVAMISGQQVDIRRTSNIMESDQALWLARGAESWAVKLLYRDRQGSRDDSLNEEWAAGMPPMEVPGGTVSGSIVDLNARFNLNNMVATEALPRQRSRQQFGRLLALCELPPELLEAVVDFIDDDGDHGWAEDFAYANREPPYRTANRPLLTPSELLQVQGMTLPGYQCLEPLVTALPVRTTININTAPAKVLAALADKVSIAQAEQLAATRPAKGYRELTDFLAAPMWVGTGLIPEDLSLGSDYFLLRCQTTFGRGRTLLFSLLQRRERGVRVLQRTLGTY